jgi:hypothetical protein
MARFVRLLWPVLLAACVDLTPPKELRGRDGSRYGELPDGESPEDVGSVGGLEDAFEPTEDADELDGPDLHTTGDAPSSLPDGEAVPPDVTPPDAPLLTNGSRCVMGRECQSGLCVDKFCCNSVCNGTCQACDVAGSEGQCTPIKAGDDPDDECDTQAISTCGRDGSCDGLGGCRKYPVGMTCASGSCSGSTETGASTCSATGSCVAATPKMCPGGHTCVNGSCASMCTADTECQNGFYCDANKTCQVKRVAGVACTGNNQCASNFCADGVCCNIACDQTCYACDLPGSVGTCNPIPDGMERGAAPECPAQDMSSCGRQGGCNGRGACRLWASGTPCGTPACTGSTQSDAPVCNGNGTCSPPVTHDCMAYVCNGSSCFTTCSTGAQCKAGYTCVGTSCRLVKITKLVVHDNLTTNPPATNASLWSLQSNFQIGMSGAHPWADTNWVNTFVTSMEPAGNVLLGKEWIKVSAESKRYTGGPEATITLSAPSNVYLFVDDRWGTPPAWIMGTGWTAAGFKAVINEPPSRPMLNFTIYKKAIAAAGDVDLPKIGGTTAYNYFVVVE